MKYDVLSPDGFSIHIEDTYNSKKEAWQKAKEWSKNYEGQGYYSSAKYGRIPVDQILDYCKLIPLREDNNEEEYTGDVF